MTLGRTLRVDPAALPAAGVRATHDSPHEDYRWTLAKSGGEGSPTRKLQKADSLRGQATCFPKEHLPPPEPSPGPRNKPDHHYVCDIPFSGPAPRPGLTLIQPLGAEQAAQLSATGSCRPAPMRETNPLSPTYLWRTSHDAVGVYPLGPPSPTHGLPSPIRAGARRSPNSPTGASSEGLAEGGGRGGMGGTILPEVPHSPVSRSAGLDVSDIAGARPYPRTRSRQAAYSSHDYSDVPGTSSKPSSPVRQRMMASGRQSPPPIDAGQRGMWSGAVGAVPASLRRTQRLGSNPNAPEYHVYGRVISDEEAGLGISIGQLAALKATGRLEANLKSNGGELAASARRSWQDPGEGGLVGAMQALQSTGARTWPQGGPNTGPAPRHGLPVKVQVVGQGVGGGGGGNIRAHREQAAAVAEVAALV